MDPRDPQLLDDGHADHEAGATAGAGAAGDAAPGTPTPGADGALGQVAATGVRRRRRRRSAARNLVEWGVVLVGALLVAFAVKTWFVQAFYIPSGSMEPTLKSGDRVLVNKIGYDLGDVRRGHIVVFERPEGWNTGEIDDLIKRVIALPNETVAARDGVVYVNGEPLDEPWLTPENRGITRFEVSSGCVPQCTLGPDEIFVLGDNRSNSSASNVEGPIDFDLVVGRAFLRIWPPGDIGGL